MNFREAIFCLDEYSVSIANFSGMLKPNSAQGELGEALRKVNDALMEKLKDRVKESTILSILINEDLIENREQMADFPAEWAQVLEALARVKLASNTAAEAQAEYLRETAARNAAAKAPSALSAAIDKFRREAGLMGEEESEEQDRDLKKDRPDPVETLNTPDPIEICLAAETNASGNEAGAEIRIEPFESPSAENSGEECGPRANSTDDAESLLNWVADINRTSLIWELSNQAEAAQSSASRQRTGSAKHGEAMDYVDQVNRILTFFRDGKIMPGMSQHELNLCESFRENMQVRGLW